MTKGDRIAAKSQIILNLLQRPLQDYILKKELSHPIVPMIRILIGFFIFSFLTSLPAHARVEDLAKTETAFIYQFTKYIDWPRAITDSQNGDFVISIVGNSPILKPLEELARLKTIKGKKITLQVYPDGTSVEKSNIVIIALPDEPLLQQTLKKTRGTSALIISHAPHFGKKGSMINFFMEQDQLRFEVNLEAIKKEQIEISSQLLNLARLVK